MPRSTLVRVHRLLSACDGSLQQAACELRWLTEALVQRRISRRTAPVHKNYPLNPSANALLARLASPLSIRSPAHIEQIAQSELSQHEQHILDRWINQRTCLHKPLQYIIGTQPFGDLSLLVRSPTLIPRWETEEWVMRLADILEAVAKKRRQDGNHTPMRILELCSGSGCISFLLANRLRAFEPRIVAVDTAIAAVLLARLNQRRLGIGIHPDPNNARLVFCQGDLFHDCIVPQISQTLAALDAPRSNSVVTKMFDLIVANPPYICPADYNRLDASVRDWEDKRALLAPDQAGIIFFKRIEKLAEQLLAPNQDHPSPRLVFEIDPSQSSQVSQRLGSVIWSHSEVWKDMAGYDRAVIKY